MHKGKAGICASCDNEESNDRYVKRQYDYLRTHKDEGITLEELRKERLFSDMNRIEKRGQFVPLPAPKKVFKSCSSKLFLDPDEYRVATFDIETQGLQADAAIVFCCTLHTYGTREKPQLFRIDLQVRDLLKAECELVEEINESVSEYDGLIGYFSTRYDLPFLRVRSMLHDIKPIPKIKMLDTYYTIKRICRPMGSKRLKRVNELLRFKKLPEMPTKTDVEMFEWIKCVLSRDEKCLDKICDHNIADVMVLEDVTREFADFVPDKIMRY